MISLFNKACDILKKYNINLIGDFQLLSSYNGKKDYICNSSVGFLTLSFLNSDSNKFDITFLDIFNESNDILFIKVKNETLNKITNVLNLDREIFKSLIFKYWDNNKQKYAYDTMYNHFLYKIKLNINDDFLIDNPDYTILFEIKEDKNIRFIELYLSPYHKYNYFDIYYFSYKNFEHENDEYDKIITKLKEIYQIDNNNIECFKEIGELTMLELY